ncbi:MAG TPA: UPF0175 family protein [Candidatus Nanoarchaeia archaeon]|nr:UPF0175 family protein [Candidatus Nanoarchaeia archaeon]
MDKQKKFLGARMEPEIIAIVDRVSEEKKVDRTSAIKILVFAGWKELRLEKSLALYKEGKIAVDKAAKIAELTVSEMMEVIAAHGIKSDETLEEYRQGVKVLMGSV